MISDDKGLVQDTTDVTSIAQLMGVPISTHIQYVQYTIMMTIGLSRHETEFPFY